MLDSPLRTGRLARGRDVTTGAVVVLRNTTIRDGPVAIKPAQQRSSWTLDKELLNPFRNKVYCPAGEVAFQPAVPPVHPGILAFYQPVLYLCPKAIGGAHFLVPMTVEGMG